MCRLPAVGSGRMVAVALAVWIAILPAAALPQTAPSTAVDYAAFVMRAETAIAGDRQSAPAIEERILSLTNVERQRRRLPALARSETLARVARAHSWDMGRRRYFAHDTPEGLSPHDRVAGGDRTGVYRVTAENLWLLEGQGIRGLSDLAERAVSGWMDSPGHRENILRPGLSHLGVGVVFVGDRVMATQMFGGLVATLAEPLPPRIRRGQQVPIRIARNDGRAPTGLSLIDPKAQNRPGPPSPLADGILPRSAGTFRLGIYVPETANSFQVLFGPLLVVE